MKKMTMLILILVSLQTFVSGQSDWDKFEKIEDVKSSNAAELAQKITNPFDDELDKIKAIYYWVAQNIRYDYGIVEQRAKEKGKRKKYTKEELAKRHQNEIKTALKRKKGVCQHYALIFEELCTHADIESQFIGGMVKNSAGRMNSHAWNAVKYKEEWQLLDVTYGSGGLNEKEKFIPRFDPNFFFVDKEIFRINHLPKDSKWQLLDNKIEKEEFENYLAIGTGYIGYDIQSLNQKTYKIKIGKKEDLVLEFKTNKPIENLICFKPSTGKFVEMKVEENDLNYRIHIDYAKMRGGNYLFMSGKNMLFSYKIERK